MPRSTAFLLLATSLALGLPAGAVLVRRGLRTTATVELPDVDDAQLAALEAAGVLTPIVEPLRLTR